MAVLVVRGMKVRSRLDLLIMYRHYVSSFQVFLSFVLLPLRHPVHDQLPNSATKAELKANMLRSDELKDEFIRKPHRRAGDEV